MRLLRSWPLILLVVTLVLGGCDRVHGLWASSDSDSDSDSDEREPESETERQLRRERELAELAKLETARLERERLAAETRRRQIEEADALVERWATRLEADKTEAGAFIRHEGLTADDPWGRPIRVRYTADADEDRELLDVCSAGPNGQFDDEDDLVRTRATQIDRGWWARNRVWVIIASVWLTIGLFSAGGLRRRRRGKQTRENDYGDDWEVPLALLYVSMAPLSLLFWIVFIMFDMFGDQLD